MLRSIVGVALAWGLATTAPHAAEVSVSQDATGPVVSILGVISAGDAAALGDALSGRGRATVVLDSPGGDAGESLDMARQVRSSGADTRVATGSSCASACFIVFAAGARRSLGPGSTVAVHGAAEADGSITPRILDIDQRMRRASSSYGVPVGVTDRMSILYGRGLHVLSEAELRTMHVAPPVGPGGHGRGEDLRSALGPTIR